MEPVLANNQNFHMIMRNFKRTHLFGSDGLQHRTCYLWASFKVDYRLVVEYWLQQMLGDKPRSNTLPNLNTSNNTSNLPLAQIEKVA